MNHTKIEVKEHPIIFSTESVRAILEGRKTQTRRVIKPRKIPRSEVAFLSLASGKPSLTDIQYETSHPEKPNFLCPYGQVGDRLWVRETHYRYGRWIKNGFTKTGKQKWIFKGAPELITLSAIRGEESLRYINNPPDNVKLNSYRKEAWYKRVSIFMPRWASRINLEITGLRVERLQEISSTDVMAEGVDLPLHVTGITGYFITLWDSLNAKRGYGWATNPWVWVIEFRRLR